MESTAREDFVYPDQAEAEYYAKYQVDIDNDYYREWPSETYET